MIPNKYQFSGSLIGQCLGDSLGFIVEGCQPDECRKYVFKILKRGKKGKKRREPYLYGQYSDDSQLTREILLSYAEHKNFDPKDYARRIATIFKNNKVVGYGKATEEAAKRLIKGVAWDKAGTPAPSAGNGSAMRAAAIGLLFFDKTKLMVQAAYDQGIITHQDKRCSAGAVAIAGAVALVLQSESLLHQNF